MLTRFEPPLPSLPFEFRAPERFAELRAMLARAGYREPDVYERIRAQEEAAAREDGDEPRRYKDAIGVLLDLFRGMPVPQRVVTSQIGEPETTLLKDFHLVAPAPDDPEVLQGTVLLYPTESLFVVSDLQEYPDPERPPPADVVYPAITKNTQQFLELLPELPCERFLELCAGTGIAAMVASRFAAHAWAVDITERATRFAEFNLQLNGIQNVTALQGDLYEPVRGRTFDFIVAHPPYIPAPRQEFIFRDGGTDGEEITRRILAGLPEYLEPGGRFYCTCMATDRRDAPLEQRVREALGEHAAEFDVIVLQRFVTGPQNYYGFSALSRTISVDEATERATALERLGVERLVYGSILVQRRERTRPVFTARHLVGPATDTRAIEWMLTWRVMSADPALDLLGERPIASRGMEIRVTHRAPEGEWRAEVCRVAADYPFVVEADCALWIPQFLARCDGTLTLREHLRVLKEQGAVEADTSDAKFVAYVRQFLDYGLLRTDTCRVPATPVGA